MTKPLDLTFDGTAFDNRHYYHNIYALLMLFSKIVRVKEKKMIVKMSGYKREKRDVRERIRDETYRSCDRNEKNCYVSSVCNKSISKKR